jgi:hypothetical protein
LTVLHEILLTRWQHRAYYMGWLHRSFLFVGLRMIVILSLGGRANPPLYTKIWYWKWEPANTQTGCTWQWVNHKYSHKGATHTIFIILYINKIYNCLAKQNFDKNVEMHVKWDSFCNINQNSTLQITKLVYIRQGLRSDSFWGHFRWKIKCFCFLWKSVYRVKWWWGLIICSQIMTFTCSSCRCSQTHTVWGHLWCE